MFLIDGLSISFSCRSIFKLSYHPSEFLGVIATADCDSHFFSTLPTSFGGQAKLIIYDLHTLHNRFYFHDSVVPSLTSAQSILHVSNLLSYTILFKKSYFFSITILYSLLIILE